MLKVLLFDKLATYALGTDEPELLPVSVLINSELNRSLSSANKCALGSFDRYVAYYTVIESMTDKQLIEAFEKMCRHKFR